MPPASNEIVEDVSEAQPALPAAAAAAAGGQQAAADRGGGAAGHLRLLGRQQRQQRQLGTAAAAMPLHHPAKQEAKAWPDAAAPPAGPPWDDARGAGAAHGGSQDAAGPV